MNEKQAHKKLYELEAEAVNRFLEKIDWDATEWLDENELKEYTEAWELVHGEKLDGSDADIVDTTDGIGRKLN